MSIDPRKTIEKSLKYLRNPDIANFQELQEQTGHLEDIADNLKLHKQPLDRMNAFLESIKGEKGDKPTKGTDYYTEEEAQDFLKKATPIRGQHYFTNEDINAFVSHILEKATPVKGKDYYEGRDGKDGRDGRDGVDGISPDVYEIVKQVLLHIPRPKNGRDGRDGKEGQTPKLELLVKEVIKTIKKDVSVQDLKDGVDTVGQVRLHSNMMKNMPKSLIEGDQRWGGHGVVLHAGSNVTITQNPDGSYTISSTGGGGTNTWVTNEIATGSGTSFTIASSPTAGTVHVYGEGQRLELSTDYSISGTAITTVNSWNSGDILVDYMTSQASAIFTDNEVVSGSGTSFTLAGTPVTGTEHIYAVGQRLKLTTDYSITGTAITTVNSWSAGDLIADYVTSAVSTDVDNEVVSGSSTAFILANSPLSNSVQLYGVGQRLYPTTDYSISGSNITTINSWSSGDLISDYRK